MMGKVASTLWLRWLLILLLSLTWAAPSSVAALAERSDFGHSSLAAKTITAPFKSGEIITREFASSGGPVEMAAEAIINGRSLHLKDIAVFPKAAESLDIGMREVLRLRGATCRRGGGHGLRLPSHHWHPSDWRKSGQDSGHED